MDSDDDDLFGDEGLVFDDRSELPTDDLPTDADSLYSLVRDLTTDILALEWEAAVYRQYSSGALHRAYMHRARAMKALGPPTANDAIEVGRRQFADWFTNDEARQIFLSGTFLERDILVTESKLLYLKWLAKDGPNGKAPLIKPA